MKVVNALRILWMALCDDVEVGAVILLFIFDQSIDSSNECLPAAVYAGLPSPCGCMLEGGNFGEVWCQAPRVSTGIQTMTMG
jgi:hypothetical protein